MGHYLTVTLQISGYREARFQEMHDHLRQCLRVWKEDLTWGELTISFQDQAQIDQEATAESTSELWDEEAHD